jgi:hypothetical protein
MKKSAVQDLTLAITIATMLINMIVLFIVFPK